jgi:hypothetical protein
MTDVRKGIIKTRLHPRAAAMNASPVPARNPDDKLGSPWPQIIRQRHEPDLHKPDLFADLPEDLFAHKRAKPQQRGRL